MVLSYLPCTPAYRNVDEGIGLDKSDETVVSGDYTVFRRIVRVDESQIQTALSQSKGADTNQ